jgi:hypothetical protein
MRPRPAPGCPQAGDDRNTNAGGPAAAEGGAAGRWRTGHPAAGPARGAITEAPQWRAHAVTPRQEKTFAAKGAALHLNGGHRPARAAGRDDHPRAADSAHMGPAFAHAT